MTFWFRMVLTAIALVAIGKACQCEADGSEARMFYGETVTMKVGSPAMATFDWSQCSAVESVPGKVSGAWVLRGTRMPVATIFENIEAGANIDDIMEWFDGLDREQVKAVIEFAARSLYPPTLAHRD